MASQERLQKSLEVLKVLSQNQPLDQSRKKDKIHHCYVISEAFSNPTIKVSANFAVLLGVTIETFLKLCDDNDSDIRMTADECLNRMIRVISDDHMGKIQIELHKEIKKNGPARSLRAALLRFSQLTHHIRPHKGKPYVANLFPALVKLADRTEETLHETMTTSLPKIFATLGIFAPDSDIKALLKAFLHNIVKPSAAIRRTSSNIILSICMHSRRPYVFVIYCINHLLDLVIPVDANQSSHTVLGVLHCLRVLLPFVKNDKANNSKDDFVQPVPLNKLLQIYELCIYYLSSSDHNVINASLDTLNVFLLNLTIEVRDKLLSAEGIDKTRIQKSYLVNNFRSPSQVSVSTTITIDDSQSTDLDELTETIDTDFVNHWIGQSKLSVLNMPHVKDESCDTLDSHADNCESIQYYDSPMTNDKLDETLKYNNDLEIDKFSDRSSEKSIASEGEVLEAQNELYEIDIGTYLDKSVPLLHCIRLITKLFLLSGTPQQYISDKIVRVSVKSSAFTCLCSIFQLYPYGFHVYLDKNFADGAARISAQKISDVLLLADHSDPQLRGIARCLVSDLVNSVLMETKFQFELWRGLLEVHMKETGIVDLSMEYGMKEFVHILLKGLQDENSNCLKQTLICLKSSLNSIAESSSCREILPILEQLPILANNPYWLVKVALCELVSNLSYLTLHYITGNMLFQKRIVYNVLFEFLKDNDQRIRSAAVAALSSIIDHLYFEDYHPRQHLATTKGIYYVNEFLSDLYDKKEEKDLRFVENMPCPYSQISARVCDRVDYLLSKVVLKLYNSVLESNLKPFIFGCIEALSALSNKYPCTIYRLAWGIPDGKSKSDLSNVGDLLGLCISLLNSSILIHDISFITNLMNLTSNLYAGYAISSLKPVDITEKTATAWTMLDNETLKSISDQYLLHSLKLLNIFHHVINDMVPQTKTVLTHLPTPGTLSPIKRRKSDDKKLAPTRILSDKEEKSKETRISGVGSFSGSPHYMKLFELLRGAFVNYKTSLDPASSDNFTELMRTTLHTFGILMEVGSLNEFGRIAEEILLYLKTTFSMSQTGTVQCVQQLLKCLFGTNLTSNMEIMEEHVKFDSDTDGFYHNIFQKPCEEMASCVRSLSSISKIECDGDSTVMGYLHRRDVKKRVGISRSSDRTLANYIRIFEPIVINSLKQYTLTSDVIFQCHVLKLLSQLVQLRVNYCMLDSEQVFKDFVLKQFEYIEEGLVPHTSEIIPRIFQFLVQLSYSKQHSKSIIDIPKIIQLCDGLMASGQDPQTHCIPALEPIVEDVFLIRSRSNTTDMKELETTREVVLSMLLRLLEYKEVIILVTLVLEDSKYCTDDTEKWLRWSGQVAGVFLQMLRQDKIRINNLETFIAVRRFIFALNPNVFRPGDDVILLMFRDPPDIRDLHILTKWLSKILLLFIMISPIKEEALLSKMDLLKAEFGPGSVFQNFTAKADPLNVYNNADTFKNISAGTIVARLIFRIITIASSEIAKTAPDTDRFFVGQLSRFLMYFSHAFQSGSLCKVSKIAMSILNRSTETDIDIEKINDNFLQIKGIYPTVTFQWCHILSVLNYNSLDFWNLVIKQEISSINECIVTTGGAIVLCDYLNENISETKQLYWILSEHSEKLVSHIDEGAVAEFVSFIHRNATLSKVFVASIRQHCLKNPSPLFKTKILKCIENCHNSQTGDVIKLVTPKMLSNRQVAISRQAATLACRKIEFLFTLSNDEVLKQMSKDDLFIIKEELNMNNMAKKHETLISLLNKLLVKYHAMSPVEFSPIRKVKPDSIRKLVVNKKWFLAQIQTKYQDGGLRRETSKAMERLEYNELGSFMSSADFNMIILRDCLEAGVKMVQNGRLKEEPPVLRAAVDNILREVGRIVGDRADSFKISAQLDQSFNSTPFQDESYSSILHSICYSLSSLIKYLSHLPTLQISETDCENISKFPILALEYIVFMINFDKDKLNISYLEVLLDCTNEILKQSHFCNYLGLDSNITWLCGAINYLYYLVDMLLKNDDPLPSIIDNLPSDTDQQKSCHKLYILTCWLYKIQNKYVKIPIFLLYRIKSLIVSLSRLPLVNSYALVPGRVFKLGWNPELSGKFLTQVPSLPIDMLQEVDVLEECIFRVTLLGWTSRQQFEEIWMCFLSVLCTPMDNLDSADLNLARRASSLAIKAITAQLLQTLRHPVLGNKNVSTIMHVSRNTPIKETTVSVRKLKIVQNQIENKYNEISGQVLSEKLHNVFRDKNFEKISDQYSYGQISIRYFLVATDSRGGNDTFAAKLCKKRVALLKESGLDVNSCLQFLLDYFTQLVKSESAVTDMRILHETVRSTMNISDIFTDKAQFTWMLNMFLDLAKIHAYEDELLHQFLIVGICKAVGVLTPELEVYEQVKKLLVQFLRSPFLPARISCLYGLLYMLEGCVLSNKAIAGISEELQLILPCAVEYVMVHLKTNHPVLSNSEEHTMLVWALAFYLIENIDEMHMELNFVGSTLQVAIAQVQRKSLDYVDKCIMKGLERLLLMKPLLVLEKIGNHLQKLALDKMKYDNPSVSILGMQLLVTYMYVDCWEHLETNPDSEQSSPDHLVQTIEKISALFDRIKKSYVNEVELLCSILPMILKDFFSPSDILTKVIGEFLSPQQPHPRLMSGVVFQVFDSAIQLNQLSLLQDWVVFSLANFTQSLSNMATWCLTCFFISASPNEWLKSFFPYVQNRVGRYEYEDKEIFCIAGSDFYKNLTNNNQRKTFVDNFMKVKDHVDMPFSDLLNSL